MNRKKDVYRKAGEAAEPAKAKKQKPPKTKGRKRWPLVLLWGLFVLAFAWSIYKNFTAIDTHTVHEVELVRVEIADTAAIEAFTHDFIQTFHTFSSKEKDQRKDALAEYMTDSLAQLNATIEMDTAGDFDLSVSGSSIWGLEDIGEGNYKVTYSVEQLVRHIVTEMESDYIEETQVNEVVNPETGEVYFEDSVVQKEVQTPVESEVEETIRSSFYIVVHRDDAGALAVVQNPTITNTPSKSDYEPTTPITSNNVDAATVKEIDDFLAKFFALYPQADDAQLAYYVKNNALQPIYQDYTFNEISAVAYIRDGDAITAHVTVKYQDNHTGIIQLSQYVLQVQKTDNWFIMDKMF